LAFRFRKLLFGASLVVCSFSTQPAFAACTALSNGVVPFVRFNSANNATYFSESTTTATALIQGAIVYDTTNDLLKVCDGTAWQSLGGGGGGSSQWTTTGSDIYYNTGNVGIGTAGPSSKLFVQGDLVFGNEDTGGPGYSLVGALDGYISYPSGRHLEFRTFGGGTYATKVYLDGIGNVGIGTTSPTNLLSLGGSAARTIWMERHSTANTAGNNLTVQSGGATSGATDKNGGDLVLSSGTATGTGSSNITFKTAPAGTTGTADRSPATAMTILGNGNVGIGTTTPNYRLTLATAAKGTTATPETIAGFGSNDGSDNLVLAVRQKRDSVADNRWTGLTSYDNGVGPANLILQDLGGNVGIGTTTPSGKLEVEGVDNTSLISVRGATYLGRLNSSGWGGLALEAFNLDYSAYQPLILNGSDLRLRVNGSEVARITSAGNVGIGTTDPKSKLDVAGGARVGADAVCSVAKAGMLAWNSNTLQVCTDAGTFTDLANASGLIGGSSQWSNGASGAIYYSGGNVGIGTTNPGAQLEIKAISATPTTPIVQTLSNAGDVTFKVDPFFATGGSGLVFESTNSFNTPSAPYMNGTHFAVRNAGVNILKLYKATGAAAETILDLRTADGNTLFQIEVGGGTITFGKNATQFFQLGGENNPYFLQPMAVGGAAGRALINGTDLTFGVAGSAQITGTTTLATSSGNVGIGTTTPNQGKMEVKGGTVCVDTDSDDSATSCIANESDIRLKKNIEVIPHALDTLVKLRGVLFDWRWDEFPAIADYKAIGRDAGVIAQEVETAFPQGMGEELNGFKTVRYERLVPLLIESVKELKAANDNLKARLDTMATSHEAEIEALRQEIRAK